MSDGIKLNILSLGKIMSVSTAIIAGVGYGIIQIYGMDKGM